jgi:hypothetical protein
MALLGLRSTTVLVVIVAAFIGSLNVADGLAAVLTLVAPLAGDTPTTAGGVVSGGSAG